MTPKQKAIQLVDIFGKKVGKELKNGSFRYNIEIAKQCALITVDEVLENVNYFFTELEKDGLPNKFDDEIEYWQEVKQEIEKL